MDERGLFFRRAFDAVSQYSCIQVRRLRMGWVNNQAGKKKTQLDNQSHKAVVNGSCNLAGDR